MQMFNIVALDIPFWNPVLPCQTLGKFFNLHCSNLLSCMSKWQAIDNGGYVCAEDFVY